MRFNLCEYRHYMGMFFLTALNLNQYATATAQPGLAVANINRVLFPVPPIAEQERITARLLKVLPMADTYGGKGKSLARL